MRRAKTCDRPKRLLRIHQLLLFVCPRICGGSSGPTGPTEGGHEKGQKGSKEPVLFQDKHRKAFETIKTKLTEGLALHTVRPDRPFILRVDASGRAVGAALEQFEDETSGMPTSEDVRTRKRVPVAFFSR